MSNYPPLSLIQGRIEDSIFHWIRKKIVEEGYLPDITTFPNTDPGTAAYNLAKKNILAGPKKYCIEIFNVGSSQSKGVEMVPRMVLRHRLNLPGSLGSPDGPNYYLPVGDPTAGGYYNQVRFPGRTTDLYYDIHLVSNSGNQNVLLHAIVEACLRGARYIPFYDNANEHFYIQHISHRDYPNTTEGIIENIYTFKISDIYMINPQIIIEDDDNPEASRIAPISCICFEIYSKDWTIENLYNKTCVIYLGACSQDAWLLPDGNTWQIDDGTAWQLPNN